MDLTAHWVGIAAIVVFVLSYSLVIAEEYTHLKKSVPVILGAGIIWSIIAYQYSFNPTEATAEAIKHLLIEFGELFLFLMFSLILNFAHGTPGYTQDTFWLRRQSTRAPTSNWPCS